MTRRIVLVLCLLAAGLSPATAADPWEFARSGERGDAEKKHGKGGYFYEYYKKAEQVLAGDASRANEAIELLKLAIDVRPESTIAAPLPARQVMEYFPYYLLAVAYAGKGEYTAALRCLQKESRDVSRSKKLAGPFGDLSASIPNLALRDTLLAQVERVRKWEGAGAEVILSPEGRTRLAPIAGLAESLRKAKPSEVTGLTVQVKGGMIDFAAGEVRANGAALSRLAAEPWKGAFARKPDLVSPSSCQAAAGGDDVAGAVASVEACSRALTQATRAAGEWACDDLAKIRGEVQKQFEALLAGARAVGGAAPAAPAVAGLPSSCIKWKDAPAAEVIASFRTLEVEGAGVRKALLAKQDELAKELEGKLAGLVAKWEAARQQLPELSGDCARDLQLGKSVDRVRTLRERLSPDRLRSGGQPDKDLLEPEPLVKSAVDDLVARIKDGVEQLQRSGTCPDIRKANLQALPGALEGYLGHSREAELTSLCTAARGARADIRECWLRNIGVVRASLGRYATLLDAAQGATGGAGRGPDCVQAGLTAIRRSQSGPAVGSEDKWVQQALADGETAQACVKDFHAAVQEDRKRVAGRVSDALDMLKAMADLGQSAVESRDGEFAALLQKAASMRKELEATEARLEELAPLYEESAAAKVADLKSRLEAAGLGSSLPGGIWPLVGGSAQNGASPDAEAWRVARDAAVAPELRRAGRALDTDQPTIAKLGPFAALNRGFAAFDRGDLDGAILALREAQAKGFLPREGKEAALAHASLALFLHTKGRALAARSVSKDLTESMHRDVQQETRLALHADAGFTPPEGLFRSRSFMETFQACRDEIQGEARTGVR